MGSGRTAEEWDVRGRGSPSTLSQRPERQTSSSMAQINGVSPTSFYAFGIHVGKEHFARGVDEIHVGQVDDGSASLRGGLAVASTAEVR